MNENNFFMKEALKEAELAFNEQEIPVGCVIVNNNKIISRGHNQTNKSKNVFFFNFFIIIFIKKGNYSC
jgi:tRNA(adenine34) deaminase